MLVGLQGLVRAWGYMLVGLRMTGAHYMLIQENVHGVRWVRLLQRKRVVFLRYLQFIMSTSRRRHYSRPTQVA